MSETELKKLIVSAVVEAMTGKGNEFAVLSDGSDKSNIVVGFKSNDGTEIKTMIVKAVIV